MQKHNVAGMQDCLLGFMNKIDPQVSLFVRQEKLDFSLHMFSDPFRLVLSIMCPSICIMTHKRREKIRDFVDHLVDENDNIFVQEIYYAGQLDRILFNLHIRNVRPYLLY